MLGSVLEAKSLRKQYGHSVAVRDVSFRVDAGQVYGLLGPNGAGKSTTIRMLSCLSKPDGGQITIDGLDATRDLDEVKRRIGIVPQDIALYEDFSAKENLVFFGRLYGMAGKDLHDRADELLEDVGLADRASHKVRTFSGGMKRRVNIAAGLVHRPKLLYLDEPTVGIDPQSRRKILDLVKTLNERGLTVLYTTHYMEEAEELCHRIGVIDHGTIIADGSLNELRSLAGELSPIEIELRGEPTPAQLRELEDDVEQVVFEDGKLILLCKDPKSALAPVLTRLANLGLGVSHLEVDEPGLEAVFLKLTGRRLRD